MDFYLLYHEKKVFVNLFSKKDEFFAISLFKRRILCYNKDKTKKGGEGMKTKLRHPTFLALHGAAVLGALLMPLYMKVSAYLGKILGGCLMHRFFIYCPLCGGTRAIAALLRFDFVAALKYNAFVVLMCFVILALDVWAWVRYFQKKEPLVILPQWVWITGCSVLVAYFILRNLLMIVFGIDPTGDLVYFWDAMRTLKG